MIVDSFLDTNVVVYAAAGHGENEHKRRRALEIVESEEFGLSVQVLQEFYVTVTRKLDVTLAPETALEWIEQLTAFPTADLDVSLVKIAAEVSERYQISYWDAAIVAAARGMGAKVLFTEDLNDGQDYLGVRATNPFR
jgi:predicted nucleic acid-binding protein